MRASSRNRRAASEWAAYFSRRNFTATSRLFNAGGAGVLVWLVILGLCSYGVMWVWVSYRRYG